MSDDRFKQARRSLINQQGQPPQRPAPANYGRDADEATALVDLNELRAGMPAQPQHHAPAPPPRGGGYPPQQQLHPHHQQAMLPEQDYAEDEHEATQMVDIASFQAPPSAPVQRGPNLPATPSGVQMRPQPPAPSGVQMRPQPPAQPLVIGNGHAPHHYADPTQYSDVSNLRAGSTAAMPAVPSHLERSGTQTLDINDLQEMEPAVADYTSGSAESTQFVDLNQLAQGTVGQPPGMARPNNTPPQQDPLLSQSYLFSPDAIQQYGAHTLIFARNQQGQDVVLKRIWEGHPDQMPELLRQKLNLLGQIQHPHLARMNGMFASHSGCWAELERPSGMRLTYMLQNGPQQRADVAFWAYPVADAMQAIHAYSILYTNLTPDAIWIDEASKSVKLEPFDLLAFEDRGNLGPFGPPEIQQPNMGALTPSTDVYTFAAVIVAALTATPDPNQVGRIPHAKLQSELVRALELNSSIRPSTFEPILKQLGERTHMVADGDKPKFNKRLIIPLVLIPLLLTFVLWPSKKGPPQNNFRQENLPALPAEDRVAAAEPPGELQQDEHVTVLNSYIYTPPEQVKIKPPPDVSGHVAKIEKELSDAKKFQNSEERYKNALRMMGELYQARKGQLSDEERALYEQVMHEAQVRKLRAEMLSDLEKSLLGASSVTSEALLTYRTFSIDPHASAGDFFERYNKAKISRVTPSPAPSEEASPDDAEDKE